MKIEGKKECGQPGRTPFCRYQTIASLAIERIGNGVKI